MNNTEFIDKILDLYNSDPKLYSRKCTALQDFFKDLKLPVKIADVVTSVWGLLFTLESKHDDNVQQVECDDFSIHRSHGDNWCLDIAPDPLSEEQFIAAYRTYIIKKLKEIDPTYELAKQYTEGLTNHLEIKFKQENSRIQSQIEALSIKSRALFNETRSSQELYKNILNETQTPPVNRKPRS